MSLVSGRRHLTVHKMNPAGKTELAWQGEVLDETDSWVKIEARFDIHDRLDLGYVVFERGDRFVEWYFRNCWYTIFEIHSRETDMLKGFYCNITKPAEIVGNEVFTVDLALDLWVRPDGKMKVLDEHEFCALDIRAADRDEAFAALKHLQHMVRTRKSPFDQVGD
jgi:predicted RNA-binding protein associated with RNAse of E/G family